MPLQRTEKSPRAPKILFVGEAVSLAHVGRPAILARWAREAGYEVAFACGEAYAHVARGEGLEPIALETIAPQTFYARLNAGQFFYTQDELERYVEAERALIRRERPDLVVGDFRLTLAVSARLEGVRLLSLQQAHWSPASGAKFPAPSAGPLGRLPRTLRGALFTGLRPVAYRVFAAPLDAVRERHGLKKRRDFRTSYTDGDFCAYLDLPELSPVAQLPRGHFFLGPLSWAPRGGSPSVPEGRLLAYVSMGSSGDERLLPAVLRAVKEAGFDALISGVEGASPGADPSVRYVGTIDPAPILKRAAVTVCHGGAGTVQQSLAAGVPVLCLPSNPDQELIARAAVRCGAGVLLPAESADPAKLRRALREAASEACREAAGRAALAMTTHDTRARWTAWLSGKLPRPAACETATKEEVFEVLEAAGSEMR
ncbi:MAG: hypothetical protein L6R28_25235 [Planctomycetes bacterium]|nr:hypothetical protein [Planctomycetota bacterium]